MLILLSEYQNSNKYPIFVAALLSTYDAWRILYTANKNTHFDPSHLHTVIQSEGSTLSMVTVACLLSSRKECADWFFLVAMVTGIIH